MPVIKPKGVKLTDPMDFVSQRHDIFDKVKTATAASFPRSHGGVRMELQDLDYDGPDDFSPAEQTKALMEDKFLTRKLRGTVNLLDEKSGELLDTQKLTLMNVPWLSNRGTFLHNGNDYSCFIGPTMIWTEEGMLPISTIVKKRLNIRVWSWDFNTGKLRLSKVVSWFKKTGATKRMKFDSPVGIWPSVVQGKRNFSTLWCTPEHIFYGVNGDKCKAADLKYVTMLEERMSISQRQMVIGSMLGDGTIQAPGCLRFTHCVAQKEYNKFKKSMMGTFVKAGKVLKSYMAQSPTSSNRCEQTVFSACDFAEMKELRQAIYPLGKRCLDTDWFKEGDERALAVWFCDDGSSGYQRKTNSPVVVLHTNNFTPADVEKLSNWLLSRWGLESSISRVRQKCPSGKPNNCEINRILNLTGDHAWRFLELVAPYMHPCLRYKALKRPHTSKCKLGCGRDVDPVRHVCTPCHLKEVRACSGSLNKSIRVRFGSSKAARELAARSCDIFDDTPTVSRWERISDSLGTKLQDMLSDNVPTIRLRSVPVDAFEECDDLDYSKRKTVYDIEVADTHNYFANGVLVSNCVKQLRLLPGPYGRRMDNGQFEVQFNVKPGSGPGYRVLLEPDTAQFRLKVGPQAAVHLYSVLRDMGVPDSKMQEDWGEGTWQRNSQKYNPKSFTQAYTSLVPAREQLPDADMPTKVQQLQAAFDRSQVLNGIMERNLPYAFPTKKASLVQKLRDTDSDDDTGKMLATRFRPDFKPDDLVDVTNAIYGKAGPRLASMEKWPAEWINQDVDPLGWLEWYQNYDSGRRSDDDDRQIRRWLAFKRRHGSQFVQNPSARRAFSLRNWGIDALKLIPEDKRQDVKQDMDKYKDKAWAKWTAKRASFTLDEVKAVAQHLNTCSQAGIYLDQGQEDLESSIRDHLIGGVGSGALAMHGAAQSLKVAWCAREMLQNPDAEVDIENGLLVKAGGLTLDCTGHVDILEEVMACLWL